MAGAACRKKLACNAKARIASNELDLVVVIAAAMIEAGELDDKQLAAVKRTLTEAALYAEGVMDAEDAYTKRLRDILL